MSFRQLFLLGLLLVAALWLSLRNDSMSDIFITLEKQVMQTLYQREISYRGLKYIDKDQLETLLSDQSTSVWWRLFPGSVARQLRQHPYVEKAEVWPCSWFALRCFKIEIQERESTLIAEVGGALWIVGGDGGFVRPVRDLKEKEGLPLVRGAALATLSPEVARARLLYIRRAVPFLEGELGYRVRELELRENGEMGVSFSGIAPEFIFAANEKGSFERLEMELRRIRALLRELGDSIDRVERVDLAFHKMAVVKLREDQGDRLQSVASAPDNP